MLRMALRTNIYFYMALRYWLLGAFAKIPETAVIFVVSVRPSIRLSVRMYQLCSHWMDCHEIFLKSDRSNDTSHEAYVVCDNVGLNSC